MWWLSLNPTFAIHTWPEYEYAAIDVFTCGSRADPWNALEYMLRHFKAKDSDSSEIKRGVIKQGKVMRGIRHLEEDNILRLYVRLRSR